MKLPKVHLLVAFTTLALGSSSPSAEGRTIQDINIIPARVLKRAISDKFYRSVLMSPVRSWVTVRGQLVGTQVTNLKVVRSEPNHANDQLALQRAREVQIAGAYTVERPNTPYSVLVHLLVYDTADGTLALSFAHLDGSGGDQSQYYGCTKMAVLKDDGSVVDIKPTTPESNVLYVRQYHGNDYAGAILKLEKVAR